MPRPLTPLAASLLGLAGAVAAAPQGPPRSSVITVKDGHGRAVDGANGVMMTEPSPDLPAVHGWFGIDPTTGGGELLWAKPSRQTGMLKWTFGDRPRAGGVLISAPDGLGALLPRLGPGDAFRMTLLPTGTIRTADGEDCVLHATAFVAERRIVLPPMRSASFPLPAGRYELWISQHDRVHWQRLDLESGATVELQLDGPTQAIARTADAIVTPTGRPDLVLLGPDRSRCTLCGEAIAAPLNAWMPATGFALAERAIPGPVQPQPIAWPPADLATAAATSDIRVGLPDGTPATAVRGFAVRRLPSTDWQVLGANTVTEDGLLRLPAVRGGDDWLLIAGDGLAPFAMPLAEWRAGHTFNLDEGTPLGVACRLSSGDPAASLRLEYVPESGAAATIVALTDRSGRASFGPVTLPGHIRVSDEHHQNDEVLVTAPATKPITIAVEDGVTLRGLVLLPDGSPVRGCTVTLRDPQGRLRPGSRSRLTDADGRFAFAGLASGAEFRLFATRRRDGSTWSSEMTHAIPGTDPLTMTIHDEDPRLDRDKDD
ncbi:MAG: carboxypeptidase regulatory-like domain-containing protein [Planctomycetes bacterium]|nr:carboxypeptidase regulatory-like domain-containing protein [Planctomycetota bacterium]